MKITKLQIKNFLGISEVEISPDKINIITGRNGQGKTSILKAIEMAFKGKIGKDIQIVHTGANKAEILVDLEKYLIKRTITNRYNELKVENEDGLRINKPQDFLNRIIGDFSFNPVEFINLTEKEQTEYLLKILDVKLTKKDLEEKIQMEIDLETDKEGLELIEEAEKYFYDERRIKNREIKEKEGALKNLDKNFDVIALEKFSEKELLKKREEYHEARIEYAHAKNELERKEMIAKQIKELEEKLKQLKKEYKSITAEKTDLEKIVERGRKIANEIKRMEEVEKDYVQFKEYKKILATKEHLEDEAKNIDKVVKLLQKEIKQELLSQAKMPVKGLNFEDGRFLINGRPLTNLSESEKLKVSIEIAKALNKKFKVICIDGAEKLDKESFEELKKEVKKGNYQFFITHTYYNNKDCIIMKKGKIKR